MRSWMIAFACGIWLASLTPALLPFHPFWLISVGALLCLFVRFLSLTGAYLLGLGWCLLHLHTASAELLPGPLENSDLWVRGTVSSLPENAAGSSRFLFRVSHRCDQASEQDCTAHWQEWPVTIRLSDYSDTFVNPAQTLSLRVRLKRPRGFANPHTFDYEAWLWEQGIRATGYVREYGLEQALYPRNTVTRIHHWQAGVRDSFHSVLARHLPGGLQRQGILEGLALGNRRGISDREWELFSMTGLTHLVVISGLHIGLVCWLGYRLAYFLWSRSCRLMQLVPAPRIAAAAALVCGSMYCLLAGFSLPATRALVMAGFVLSGSLLLRRHSLVDALFLALGLILLWSPLAVISRGFWLSFVAVAVLLLAAGSERQREQGLSAREEAGRSFLGTCYKHLHSHIRAQGVLLFGLLPFLLLFTGQISLLAPVVNLVAIPLVGMVVVPLILTGLALMAIAELPAALCFLLADCLLDGFLDLLGKLAGVSPWATLALPEPSWWQLGILVLACSWLLWPGLNRRRWLALPILSVVLINPVSLQHGQARFHVLDVGQGLAVLVETRHHLIIFDTGPAYSPSFNAGSGLLKPYIQAAGLPDPGIVVVSHGDSDHAGGLAGLLEHFPQAEVLAGEPERLPQVAQGLACSLNQSWQLDGIGFAFIHAGTDYQATSNDRSCVMRVSSGDSHVLIPGDISRDIEQKLLRQGRENLRADVLLVPHHGSISSSTPGFINRVNPALAVVSNGYLNRYGHPHEQVMARYRNRGIRVMQTAASGRISFRLSDEGVDELNEWRISHPRVWR